ncbi:MAG: hypothetical protein ACI4SC_04620 [Candidatus Neoclostridium sp.]
MFNTIAFILGLATALCPQCADKPVAVGVISPVENTRIVRVPPKAEDENRQERSNGASDANGYYQGGARTDGTNARERNGYYFDMTDYEQNKKNLDEKYSRRAYLREKMAKEMADFLADYEEYKLLSANYRKEYYAANRFSDSDGTVGGTTDNGTVSGVNNGTNGRSANGVTNGTNNGVTNGNTNNGVNNGTNNGINNGTTDGTNNGTNNGANNGNGSGRVYSPVPPTVNDPRPLAPDDEKKENDGTQKPGKPSQGERASVLMLD